MNFLRQQRNGLLYSMGETGKGTFFPLVLSQFIGVYNLRGKLSKKHVVEGCYSNFEYLYSCIQVISAYRKISHNYAKNNSIYNNQKVTSIDKL